MENKYLTKDLYLASLLCCKTKKFIGVNKSGRSFWFVFENQKVCEKVVSDFWIGKVEVNAKNFVEAIRTLKNLIFSEEEKENFINH